MSTFKYPLQLGRVHGSVIFNKHTYSTLERRVTRTRRNVTQFWVSDVVLGKRVTVQLPTDLAFHISHLFITKVVKGFEKLSVRCQGRQLAKNILNKKKP